jgi:hypothetical protein
MFLILVAVLLGFSAVAEAPSPELQDAYAGALEEHEPLQNVMRLYLRLAGVVWVAVEWIAAIFLWKGYKLLSAHFAAAKESAA